MSIKTKPFIILSNDGRVKDLLKTNEKGYKKSIENNEIWALDSETDRLLPVEYSGKAGGFRESDEWYEAVLANSNEAKKSDSSEGAESSESAESAGSAIIERLYGIIEQRKAEMPEGSYTTHLFKSGMSKIKKKTGEEAVELLLAEDRSEIVYEAADLIYHMLVLLAAADIKPLEIFKELENRE